MATNSIRLFNRHGACVGILWDVCFAAVNSNCFSILVGQRRGNFAINNSGVGKVVIIFFEKLVFFTSGASKKLVLIDSAISNNATRGRRLQQQTQS